MNGFFFSNNKLLFWKSKHIVKIISFFKKKTIYQVPLVINFLYNSKVHLQLFQNINLIVSKKKLFFLYIIKKIN